MPATHKTTVISNEQLSPNSWRLLLAARALAEQAQPGQFVQVRVTDTYDPLLRTPLSVHDCNPTQGTLALLYQTVGTSTLMLSRLQVGTELDVLGPLGHGFVLPEQGENSRATLIAGGIGVAPLLFLARELVKKQIDTRLLFGARSAADLVGIADFEQIGVTVTCCTDNGSVGISGNVIDLLASYLQTQVAGQIFACGPTPMLRALQTLVKRKKLTAQLSLEAYMACGLGACLGCAVAVPGGGFAHVCTDGPVFRESEVEL